MATILEMEVDVFHREAIKPSSPTPNHLQTFKLSLIDQFAPAFYVSVVLFYPIIDGADGFKDDHQHATALAKRSQNLKRRLSETLTHFYPLAGRIRNNFYVECNDEGAEFLEARINCSISKILLNPDLEMLRKLIPAGVGNEGAGIGPLVLVQATSFECGGTAIGLSVSHKLSDAASLKTFINCWAAIALGSGNVQLPEYGAASLINTAPGNSSDSNSSEPPPSMDLVPVKSITRRYVFDAKNVAVLQSKAASEIVKNPTRVEAVSAFIWKCAREANSPRPCMFSQVVNIRPRTVPPLPQNLIGNLLGLFTAVAKDESEIDVQHLVCKLRKGIEEVKAYYAKGLNGEEILQSTRSYINMAKGDEVDSYSCSSWCGFPLYEANFGCGKPIWVIPGLPSSVGVDNFIILMDANDGNGIEAWLMFKEEEMVLLESNREFLAFASLNPSVIIWDDSALH